MSFNLIYLFRTNNNDGIDNQDHEALRRIKSTATKVCLDAVDDVDAVDDTFAAGTLTTVLLFTTLVVYEF